jgi:hypothetical protein
METLKDGRQAVRVEVRSGGDGYTHAAMQMGGPGSPWLVLVSVPQRCYEGSADVQAKFIDLAQQVTRFVITDALDGVEVVGVKVVPPGAPFDAPTH